MSPISSTASETVIGVPTPPATATAIPLGSPDGTSLLNADWLMAWLGQTELPVEGEAPAPAPSAAPTMSTQVQWLTVLPAVPAYINLFAPVDETLNMELPAASGDTVPLPLPLAADLPAVEEPVEEAVPQTPLQMIETPTPVPQPVFDASPVPVTPVVTRALPSVEVPGEEPGSTDLTQSKTMQRFSRQSTDPQPAPRPMPQTDKGEVIWTAELVVKEKTPEPTGTVETQPAAGSEETIGTEKPAPSPSASPAKSVNHSNSNRQTSQNQSDAQPQDQRRQGSNDSRKQQSNEPPDKLVTARQNEPAKRDQRPALVETPAPHVQAVVVRTATTAENFPAIVTTSAPAPADQVGAVELETAKPLRPTQIATLYVDVPQVTGDGNTATMRLAVTQRGEQVNVQLRSWDTGITPIDNSRMQPLLQSLADQGLTSANTAIDRIDEVGSNPVEGVREKTISTSESANSNNDSGAFQNTEERQQKNQERQQQQALFMRRQMRTVQSNEFDAQSVLGNTTSSFQQGASR